MNKKNNHFREHIPAFYQKEEPDQISFDTFEELLAHDYFKIKSPKRYVLSDNALIWVSKDHTKHWVMGYISRPDLLDLPPFIPVDTDKDYLNSQLTSCACYQLRESICAIDMYFDAVPRNGSDEVKRYFKLLQERLKTTQEHLKISLGAIERLKFDNEERLIDEPPSDS